MRDLSPFILPVLALAALGCAAHPDDVGAGGSPLVEVSPGTEPLAPVASSAWEQAPESCEGQLTEGLHFELASETDGLVAAVDDSGDIVCVDSVESVEQELESEGREEDAEDLRDSYLVAIGCAFVQSPDGFTMGDPSPQPSTNPIQVGDGTRTGDPSPQPSTQASGS
jgi:hypothetical protein